MINKFIKEGQMTKIVKQTFHSDSNKSGGHPMTASYRAVWTSKNLYQTPPYSHFEWQLNSGKNWYDLSVKSITCLVV